MSRLDHARRANDNQSNEGGGFSQGERRGTDGGTADVGDATETLIPISHSANLPLLQGCLVSSETLKTDHFENMRTLMGEQCEHTIFGNYKSTKSKLVRDPVIGTRDDQKRGSRDRGGSGDISLLSQSADEKKGAPPRPNQMGTTHI